MTGIPERAQAGSSGSRGAGFACECSRLAAVPVCTSVCNESTVRCVRPRRRGPLPAAAARAQLTGKLQERGSGGRQSYFAPTVTPARSQLLSFFDDEETATRTTARAPRPAQHSQPRRPQGAGRSLPVDRHTLMVRRRVALGVGVVLLIIIIVWISSYLKSQKTQALKDYNQR